MLTNFYGPTAIIRAALPNMRQRKSGTIINITSSVTQDAFAATGLYTASKCALEGLAESLAKEIGALGIRSIIVIPGAFRTAALDATNMTTPDGAHIDAYDATPVKFVVDAMAAAPGHQPGNPAKAAARMFELVTGTGMGAELIQKGAEGLALRVVLGSDAYGGLQRQIQGFTAVSKYGREIAKSTDF